MTGGSFLGTSSSIARPLVYREGDSGFWKMAVVSSDGKIIRDQFPGVLMFLLTGKNETTNLDFNFPRSLDRPLNTTNSGENQHHEQRQAQGLRSIHIYHRKPTLRLIQPYHTSQARAALLSHLYIESTSESARHGSRLRRCQRKHA